MDVNPKLFGGPRKANIEPWGVSNERTLWLGIGCKPNTYWWTNSKQRGDSYWALQGSHRLKWRQKGSQKAEDVNDNRGFQTAWIAMPMEAWEERDREGLVGRI